MRGKVENEQRRGKSLKNLRESLGAFHLGKKPGNFGGSKSGISDW